MEANSCPMSLILITWTFGTNRILKLVGFGLEFSGLKFTSRHKTCVKNEAK